VQGAALSSLSNPYFEVNAAGDGVVFTAPVDGSHTAGSMYPRSELREVNPDGSLASWSSTVGTNVLTVTGATTELPPHKSQVIIGQVHDAANLVFAIEISGGNVAVRVGSGSFQPTGVTYNLGDRYTYRITVSGGQIVATWNGATLASASWSASGLYFKAGVYTQSNQAQGDMPPAAGSATIFSVSVAH
jgi:poly(beta-D-mannuronate) lyase